MSTIPISVPEDFQYEEEGHWRATVDNRGGFGKIHVYRGDRYCGMLLWSDKVISHTEPPLDRDETGVGVRALAASPWCPEFIKDAP